VSSSKSSKNNIDHMTSIAAASNHYIEANKTKMLIERLAIMKIKRKIFSRGEEEEKKILLLCLDFLLRL
jgi:hypothetical protein